MYQSILKCDGYDEAILGTVSMPGNGQVRILYDRDKIEQILCERDGMDIEGAREFFDFNIAGAYVGEGGPLFLDKLPDGISIEEVIESYEP